MYILETHYLLKQIKKHSQEILFLWGYETLEHIHICAFGHENTCRQWTADSHPQGNYVSLEMCWCKVSSPDGPGTQRSSLLIMKNSYSKNNLLIVTCAGSLQLSNRPSTRAVLAQSRARETTQRRKWFKSSLTNNVLEKFIVITKSAL